MLGSAGLNWPWCCATDAAATFVLTLLRLGWSAQSARHLTTHDGTKIDLLGEAPQTVGFWVDQATLVWTDSSSHWGKSKGQLFLAGNPTLAGLWELGRMFPLAPQLAGQGGLSRHLDAGPAFPTSRLGRQPLPALSRRPWHHVSPFATSARPCRWSGKCVSRRNCGRRLFHSSRNTGNSLHTAFSLAPSQILPAGLRQHSCPVLWHNRHPDGLLEGHIFTNGSSSGSAAGSGALRRAGWAVVAVDDLGNLKSAAYGAVPVDVLPEQTSRDGEDNAAAIAGPITMDPLTLHINCAGTIATIRGPKGKAVGAKEKRAHVWSRLLCSHDEVKAVKVKRPRDGGRRAGWALHPFVPTWKQFRGCVRREKVQTYTSHPFESRALCWASFPWPSKLPAGRPLGRHGGQAETASHSTSAKGKDKGKANAKRGAGDASNWAGTHHALAFLARHSTGPSLFHRAQPPTGATLQSSTRAAGRWTVPSSSAPFVGRCTGRGQMRFAIQGQRGCRLRTAEGERRGCGQLQLPGRRWRIAEGYVQGRRLHKFRSATWGWKQYARW